MKVRDYVGRFKIIKKEKYPQQRGDFGGHLRNTNSAALVSQKIIKMIHEGPICI